MDFTFPSGDLNKPSILLGLLGSFWSMVWGGDEEGGGPLVENYVGSRGQLSAQTFLDTMEYLASVSRFEVPIYHADSWYFLKLKESELNSAQTNLLQYGESGIYGGSHRYGIPGSSILYNFPLPMDLQAAPLIMNRITEPSVTLTQDVDFILDEQHGAISFRENPFSNPLVPIREIFNGNEIVDREAALWVFKAAFDFKHAYQHFGYVLGLRLASSELYRDLINAIFDGLVRGTSQREIQFVLSAMTGTSLAIETTETVQAVTETESNLLVITDQHVYTFAPDSVAVVEAGDVVSAGDPLVDTVQFFEFNRGQIPDITALVAGKGFLKLGLLGDLTFENKDVPLEVTTASDGRTRVSWSLGGFPADVEAFFDEVHARGVEQGQTLANYLDIRENGVGEPTAASLPPTINPMEFLCQNFLRYHAFLVRVKASRMRSDALGLQHARLLRKLVPPHTAMLLLIELAFPGEAVILEGPATENAAGYEEGLAPILGLGPMNDTVNSGLVVGERIRSRQVSGRCS